MLHVAGAFALVALLKWDTISSPPAWDAAMGLFPAAITLAGNGFDLGALLSMPGFLEGGPDTHSTSLVTWITAFVWAVSSSADRAIVATHVLHFLIAAIALVTLHRFARPVFGSIGSWLFSLSVLLFPLFSAQVGYMYLELPLFLCAVSALLAWERGRLGRAVVWATAAVLVKETGIIVAAALALASLIERGGRSRRIGRALTVATPPTLALLAVLLLGRIGRAGDPSRFLLLPSFEFRGVRMWFYFVDRYLLGVPDLALFLVLALVSVALTWRSTIGGLAVRSEDDSDLQRRRVLGLSALLIASFTVLCYLVLPAVANFAIVLPRYHVVIAPFLLLWVGYAAQRVIRRDPRNTTVALFGSLCVLFALNTNGRFYPPDVDASWLGNDFALAERSNGYLRLNEVQRDAVGSLNAAVGGAPVYYGLYEHFLFAFPDLGFADHPPPKGRSTWFGPIDRSILEGPDPGCLYVLFGYFGNGGTRILRFLEEVEARQELSRELVHEFRSGVYHVDLIRVRPEGAICERPEQAT